MSAYSARMKALNADPEFAAAYSARMKALNADPEFAAAYSARMKALSAARLSWLPDDLREDYRILRKKLGAAEARTIIERIIDGRSRA